MQNEFEKNIQKQMETFVLEPGDKVWEKISVQLKEEKRKRRAAWFWMSMLLLLVVPGGFVFFVTQQQSSPALSTAMLETKPGTKAEQSETSLTKTTNDQNNIEQQKEAQNYRQPSILTTQKPTNLFTPAQPQIRKVENESKRSSSKKDVTATSPLEKEGLVTANMEEQVQGNIKAEAADQPQLEEQIEGTALEESLIVDSKEVEMDSIVKATKKTATKKWTFGWTADAGASNLVENFTQGSQFLMPATGGFSSGGSSVGSPTASPNLSFNYNYRFAMGVGGFARYAMSGRFTLSLGVSYKYFSVGTRVGNRIDTLFSINDALLGTRQLDHYFQPGTQRRYNNQYHFIQLPVEVLWQVNTNQQKPIHLSAGFSPSVLVAGKGAYVSRNNNRIFSDRKQYDPLQVLANAGAYFTIFNNNNVAIQTGPLVQYGITNFSKKELQTNEHLQFLGLKMNMIIK